MDDPLESPLLGPTSPEGEQLVKTVQIPLLAGEQVQGVICVARTLEDADIGDRDIRALEAIALQTANAIQRAELFEQTEQALAAADAATHRYLRDTWDAFLEGRTLERQCYLAGFEGVERSEELWLPEMEQALDHGEPISVVIEPVDGQERRAALAIPLTARGQVIGVVDFYREGTSVGWTEREQELIQALVEQIGDSIESERQRREQLIREITSKMRGTPDLDTILNTAVQELGKALGVSRAFIRLGTGSDLDTASADADASARRDQEEQGD